MTAFPFRFSEPTKLLDKFQFAGIHFKGHIGVVPKICFMEAEVVLFIGFEGYGRVDGVLRDEGSVEVRDDSDT
jgi:hypothetical protein